MHVANNVLTVNHYEKYNHLIDWQVNLTKWTEVTVSILLSCSVISLTQVILYMYQIEL